MFNYPFVLYLTHRLKVNLSKSGLMCVMDRHIDSLAITAETHKLSNPLSIFLFCYVNIFLILFHSYALIAITQGDEFVYESLSTLGKFSLSYV